VSRRGGLVAASATALLTACQTVPPHDDIVRDHLTAIVSTQVPQCVAVRSVQRAHRLDYRVVCDSGEVFDVRVDAQGRVQIKAVAP
jgi:hypothetical protein